MCRYGGDGGVRCRDQTVGVGGGGYRHRHTGRDCGGEVAVVVVITRGWWPSPSFTVATAVDLLPSLAEGGASSSYRHHSGRWLVWFVAVIQGGSWLLGFAVEGVAVLSLSDGGHCHRRAVRLFRHWGHSQLVAVVIVVSRSGDDGHWWWWPLLSFGMWLLSPSFALVVMVEPVMEEIVTEKGLINFLKACDYISKVSFRTTTKYDLFTHQVTSRILELWLTCE